MDEQRWLTSDNPSEMMAYVQDKVSPRRLRLFACACCRMVWHLLTDERSRRAVEVAERYADKQATEKERREADNAATFAGTEVLVASASWAAAWVASDRLINSGWPVLLETTGEPATQSALIRSIVGNPFSPVVLPRQRRKCERCNGKRYTPRDKDVSWSYGSLTPAERQRCGLCCGSGEVPGDCPWLTPTVLALATAAYEDNGGKVCVPCDGKGEWVEEFQPGASYRRKCNHCHNSGRVGVGTLDNDRLAVLCDALEEAGCDDAAIIEHLRSPGPHVRGCWALDLLLNKE